MTREAFTYFARMFEANRNMDESEWFEKFPMYKFDPEMGAKPWWPPLSEVWAIGETCPLPDRSAAAVSWPDAWALLQKHFQEYLDAKQLRRKVCIM